MGVHADRALLRDIFAVLGSQRETLREGSAQLVANGDRDGWPLERWQYAIQRAVDVRRKAVNYVGRAYTDPAKREILTRAAQLAGLVPKDLADDLREFKDILDALEAAPRSTVAECRAALLAASLAVGSTSKLFAEYAAMRADESARLDLFAEDAP